MGDNVATDPAALRLILASPEQLLALVDEWMSLPDELFVHYLLWIHECYPCEGACAHAGNDNAVEMAQWLTDTQVVTATIDGPPEDFRILAQPPSGDRERIWMPHIIL
ncbi:hypothetical protein [Nocardia nepalensis]|uniref:hypothetical protein n=1 Tax=Nocardia nepalensis TaxID=3375448 RepID=UPI003B684AA1